MLCVLVLAVPSAVADDPVLNLPGDITAEATGPSGAVVTFDVTANDDHPDPTVICDQTSGDTFPIGTTTVNCGAEDTVTGAKANGSFTITVQDTTPPEVSVPSPGAVEATGPSGAVVTFAAATASDIVDGSLTPTCSASSGSTVPVGTTQVTCTAKDSHGNSGSDSFGVTVQDTTPPSVTVPSPITVDATGPQTPVTFSASASDVVSTSITPSCSPSSGSAFPVGTTTVTCTATDGSGNSASKSFTVTVKDTVKPVVTVPGGMTAEATGPAGAPVDYSASATDNVDGSITPSCSPSSGSTFPLGATTVTCTATDSSGNKASASFGVTVQDTTKPTITVPGATTVEATGPSGAAVAFSASASDLVDGSITPSCSPSSGSTFALGTTTVTCTATDKHGNSASAGFAVTVQDTTPPVLAGVPAPIVVEADGANGSRVTYAAPSASDLVDGGVPVSCAPGPGSNFHLGTTTVACSATDAHGNKGTASFPVTVRDTTSPRLNAPAPATFSSGGASQLSRSDSKVAAWLAAASAHDLVDGNVPVTNNAPAVLPLGVTVVTFTATDEFGNAASAQSRLTVVTGVAPPANLDTTPPGEVRNLKVRAGDGYVDMTWSPPGDADFDHLTVTRTTGTGESSQVVYSGKGTHLRQAHLRNGIEYRFLFSTFDKVGNRSTGLAARATPHRAVLYFPADGAVVKKPPVLRWARIGGASYYNLQLYRVGAAFQSRAAQPGQKVLSVWPSRASYRLARTWTFEGHKRQLTPGRYLWFVWPGYGAKKANRYGTVLGQSSFVVR